MSVYHKWQPITELESAPEALADEGLRTMLAVWREQKGDISPEALRTFDEKLRREWAVETGLIEGIYTLDRGITETLIERGIDAALIPHRPGQLPEKTAAIIQDHKNVVDGLFDFVKGSRQISASYIKELHAALVQNQDTTTGVDKDGNKKEVPLIKGEYKKLPNNPTRIDGKGVHQYSPPEHTAAEMDRLITINGEYAAKGIAPEVQAAWLHHRFTQIHPFQDGNGRVARCLATLILLRAGGFPLTIRTINGERDKYINALETADGGELQPLIAIFAASQRREITRALNISHEVMEEAIAEADYQSRAENIIKSAARKITLREVQNPPDNAQIIAKKMHKISMDMLAQTKGILSRNITASKTTTTRAAFSVDENTEKYDGASESTFSQYIGIPANEFGYHPNADAYYKRALLLLRFHTRSHIFIFFHGVGQTYRGVIVCSASFFSYRTTEQIRTAQPITLNAEPFYINNQDTAADVEKRFRPWLESAIERGLAIWHKSL